MSWDILPKNVLQYFLTKLKGLMYTKTEVDNLIPSITPNPSTTTGVLNGLEINGTAYEIQGTGEPNVQADWNEIDSTADDYIKNKPTIPTYNFFGVNFHSGNGSSQEHDCNNMTENGVYYYTTNGPALTLGTQSTDGAVMVMAHSTSWLTQLAQDYRTGKIFVRSRNNGSWMKWREVMSSEDDSSNVTMDDIATWGNTMGMANLKSANANINPNNQTGWHHFINISYTQHSGSNMWQTQLACKAGTSDVYVRSRSGGSVSGAAWAAPWVRLAKTSDIPTVPTVGNGSLLLQKNGTTISTFMANQSSNTSFNVVNTVTSFTMKTVSFNVSVGAYSDGVYRPNISNSGWTPLGIVGLYTGMTTLFALRYGLENSTTARVDLHNVHSAAVSGTASVTVLYYKNTDS